MIFVKGALEASDVNGLRFENIVLFWRKDRQRRGLRSD